MQLPDAPLVPFCQHRAKCRLTVNAVAHLKRLWHPVATVVGGSTAWLHVSCTDPGRANTPLLCSRFCSIALSCLLTCQMRQDEQNAQVEHDSIENTHNLNK
jgi:hypothetical protein